MNVFPKKAKATELLNLSDLISAVSRAKSADPTDPDIPHKPVFNQLPLFTNKFQQALDYILFMQSGADQQ